MKDNVDKILSDCRPDWAFWTCNGTIIRNLHELRDTITGLNDGSFAYHVSNDHDDFAKWVHDVIGDENLAKTLDGIKERKKYISALNRRLTILEKKAHR